MKKEFISIVGLLIGIAVLAQGRVESYPLPSIYGASFLLSLQVGDVAVPIVDYNPKYDYTHFSVAGGPVQVVITLLDGSPVTDYFISPKKTGIVAVKDGNKLIFELKHDQYLIVKINQLKELVILADPPETDIPPVSGKGIFNVLSTKYGMDTASIAGTTKAFQTAIDEASAFHGGTVVVPPGIYKIGNIELKSNSRLYLPGGAVLLFTGRRQDYRVNARKRSQNRDITWWIYTDSGAHDIKVFGRGTLDGNGMYATAKENNIGNHILAIFQTSKFVFDGPIVRNSGAWGIIPTRSRHIAFKNIKILNRLDMGENDGMDVMESEDVLVKHGIGIALDDPFSTKTWQQNTDLCRNWSGHPLPQKDVVFEDLLSWTYCYAFKIGQGVMQPQTRIVFRNCVAYDAAVAIGIHHKWGTSYVRDVVFDHIEVDRLTHQNDNHRTWCVLFMQNGDHLGSGPISDVRISHVRVYDAGETPGKIGGVNPGTVIDGVRFKDIWMPGMTGAAETLEEMRITDTVNCRNVRVAGTRPAKVNVGLSGKVGRRMDHFERWPAGKDPEAVGRLLTDRFIATPYTNFGQAAPPSSITYSEVCAWFGALRFSTAIRDTGLSGQLYQRFEPLLNERAGLVPKPDHVDHSVFGAVPLELYRVRKDTSLLRMGKSFADRQWDLPVNAKEGQAELAQRGLSWQSRFWIDDMFMITLLQTRAYAATGDTAYAGRAAREMIVYLSRLQRPNGLFFHAEGVPFFWGRGNGWMAAGMTELLLALPEGHPQKAGLLAAYRKMMERLLRYQSFDGMWRQLVDDPGAWPETSCTGMFTYAMIVGVREGWLDEKVYGPAARKGWLRLTDHINPDGDVREICEGTNKLNDRQYYLDRKRITGDMHGQAPVLWCAWALINSCESIPTMGGDRK
jgi:rhamnogalacturonyl hydrolase YesR